MHKPFQTIFRNQRNAYKISDIGACKFGGQYSSKSSYLEFLQKLANPPSQKSLSAISTNFKKLFKKDQEISSVGIGSYLGDPTDEDDHKLFNALVCSIKSGINVIDTAANYRYCKSERTIGAALRYLIETETMKRSDVFLSTKIGYITEDADKKKSVGEIIKEVIEFGRINPGLLEISVDDFLGESHSIHPTYINYQLEKSLENMNVNKLDVMYLHNPFEGQLALKGKEKTFDQLAKAFEVLEKAILDDKIVNYGLASFNCFRARPDEEGIHASLEEVVRLAEKIGGKNHGLRFAQIPMSFIMHEGYSMPWQFSSKTGANVSAFQVCEELEINVVTSASLMQKVALKIEFPFEKLGLESNAQAHLHLLRSMPFPAVKSSLVGVTTPVNVEEFCRMMSVDKMGQEAFKEFIQSLGVGKK